MLSQHSGFFVTWYTVESVDFIFQHMIAIEVVPGWLIENGEWENLWLAYNMQTRTGLPGGKPVQQKIWPKLLTLIFGAVFRYIWPIFRCIIRRFLTGRSDKAESQTLFVSIPIKFGFQFCQTWIWSHLTLNSNCRFKQNALSQVELFGMGISWITTKILQAILYLSSKLFVNFLLKNKAFQPMKRNLCLEVIVKIWKWCHFK